MKRISCGLLAACLAAAPLPAGGARLRSRGEATAVRSPKVDPRKYQHVVFDNGLSVLAVEDAKAAKSGFAVAVSAGSFYDPPELPGLAHFCEHLLFLGTKKYPDETSFDTFLSQHDGSNNAYTEQERTVFYNEVSHAGFDEGLDRFAQFFIAPLFKPELVGRELEAVNSEHMKNVPDMGRRLWELARSTARNGSVVGRFYTGTTESLHHGDSSTVGALHRYHAKNYCARRMSLVVVSNRSLADQLALARARFGAVPGDGCDPAPRDFGVDDRPYEDADSVGRMLRTHTDSVAQMWLTFNLPPTLREYRAQPASMLQYLLNYGGPGSLKSRLKAQGWVSDLELQVDQNSATTLLYMMFTLTPSGVNSTEAISSSVFAYLSQLRAGAAGAIRSIYPTMEQMSLVTFDYQEAPDSVMDMVSALAAAMSLYAPSDTLSGDTVVDQMDEKLVGDLVARLTPDSVNIVIATSDFDDKQANRVNEFYSMKYADHPIPERLMKGFRAAFTEEGVALPPPLRYVPTQLTAINKTAGKVPMELGGERSAEVWWLGHGHFDLPKAQVRLKVTVPKEAFGTAEFVALRKLHVELSSRVLEELTEDFVNCGMNWDLKDTGEGYHLSMDGYSEHLATLASTISGRMAAPDDGGEGRFAQAKQKLLDQLRDTTSQMAYEHAMDALAAVSTSSVFGREDVLMAMKAVTRESLASYLHALRARGLRLQVMTTGSLDEAASLGLARAFAQELGVSKSLPKAEVAESEALKADDIEVEMPNPIPGDENSATVNAYQLGVPDVAERVKALMLGKMISQPAYDTLRTKDQLGYIVFGVMMPHLDVLELRLIVQGSKATPEDVDGRMEALLDSFRGDLANMSQAEFSRWKSSLRSTLSREDRNMGQEADRFWAQISTDKHCFRQQELALEFLDSLHSPATLLSEFERFRGKSRRKISVRLLGSKLAALQGTGLAANTTQIGAASLLRLRGDGLSAKQAAAVGRGFWPTAGTCEVHWRQ